MATKNNPGEFDCYANAEPDEPMFILLGRDKHAPTLVWLWASLRELDGEDAAKVTEARNCMLSMMAWQHDRKRPVVGLGQATLAGVMELIRGLNAEIKRNGDLTNEATDDEVVRRFLAETHFDREQ